MIIGVDTQAVVLSVVGVIAIIGIALVIIAGAMYFSRQEHAQAEDDTEAAGAEDDTEAGEPETEATEEAEQAEEPESASPPG